MTASWRPSMTAVMWGLVALSGALVVYPLLVTVLRVATDRETLDAIRSATLLSEGVLRVLGTTAIVVGASTALAVVVGALLAWINERTDAGVPFVGDILPLAPILVSPLAGAIGMVVLFDPRVGLVNGWLRSGLAVVGIAPASGPLDLYTPAGLILVTALYLVPYVYLVAAAALRTLDPSLEEASRVNGAGPWRTLRRVTLPAIAPALAAAAIVAVIVGVGLFSVPVIIGTPARIDVLAVHIFRLLDQFPPRTAEALLLAGLMLVVVQALLVVDRRLIPRGQHAAVGGRGFRRARVELGPLRTPARLAGIAYLAITAVLPVIGLGLVSLQPFWTPQVQWERLSLANYAAVFGTGAPSRALVTSLALGGATATVVLIVAGLVMLHVHHSRIRGGGLVDAITALPATIPHTVIGVSFLMAFSRPPLQLHGTMAILLLAYVVMAMPFAARAASAAARDIGPELAEASRVFGASERRTFARILFPLALPGLAAGWVMVFILSAGEVTASALLSGTANPVVGRVMLELSSFGSFPQVTAMAMVVTAINAVFVTVMLRITRRTADVAMRP